MANEHACPKPTLSKSITGQSGLPRGHWAQLPAPVNPARCQRTRAATEQRAIDDNSHFEAIAVRIGNTAKIVGDHPWPA